MAHRLFIVGLVAAIALSARLPVFAQQRPTGAPVLNQGINSGAITPSDTIPLQTPTRAIYNGNSVACNIAMKIGTDSAATTWQNVQPGELLPVSATAIMNTNTSCSNLVAIW